MNPFRYGRIVDKAYYCSRPELEKKLQSHINSCQNTYIEGERRTGKTSLIFQTIQHAKSKWIVYIDLLEVRTVEDINKRVLNGIAKASENHNLLQSIIKHVSALRPVVSFDPITSTPSVSIDTTVKLQPESLDGLFDLFSGKDFRNAVIAIDEFQDIKNLENSNQVLAIMRSKIQFLNKIPFIFCGSMRNEMHLIFNDPESPFYKSALPLLVEGIDQNAFGQFISDKFEKNKREISHSMINKILTIAHGNPGDTQQLCSALYEVSEQKSSIDDVFLNEALQYLFAEERKGYEAQMTRLTSIQLKCLTAVARIGGKSISSAEFMKTSGVRIPTTIRKAISRLVELKILYMSNGEFRFVNPFFAQWLVFMNY
jgi:AAA+ ATPase superfamily predicted ATPase